MPTILNQAPRAYHTQIFSGEGKSRVISKRFTFNPAQIVIVTQEEMRELKKCKTFKEELDNDRLVTGAEAKKKGNNLEKEVNQLNEKSVDLGKEKVQD